MSSGSGISAVGTATPAGYTPLYGIPENKAKEWVSLSYLEAITAQVGLNISNTKWDDGLDMHIGSTKPLVPNFNCRNFWLALQVKSTADWAISNGKIPFFLKQSNYDQLRASSLMPQFLILYTFPQHRDGRSSWVYQAPEHVEFRSRAFYLDLTNQPPLSARSNGRRRVGRTVHVPVASRLTAVSLRNLYVNYALSTKARFNL